LIDAKSGKPFFFLSRAGPKIRAEAAQTFRLATAPAEHKITDTQSQFEKIIIIAGPNGAGKTTFARDFFAS
jgi:tRNA A37 threonylcarbamoyladenosine biosynthesis protein TsaE